MTSQKEISDAIDRLISDRNIPANQRGFIFDIDGTLALMEANGKKYMALPGASETISKLNEAGIPTVAFTNGTLHTPHEYRETLMSIGMEFAPLRVLTPANVAAEYFLKKDIRRILVLGIAGTIKPLEEAGLDVVLPGGNIEGVQAVLIGWFPQFGLSDLDIACRAVWAGATLFAVSVAPFLPSRTGRVLGISGAISTMITSVTGRRAIVLGKPATHGIKVAGRRMDRRVSNIVVVGDDPNLEIVMARRAGALAIGVSTGIATHDAFMALPTTKAAHLVIASLEDLLRSNLIP